MIRDQIKDIIDDRLADFFTNSTITLGDLSDIMADELAILFNSELKR